MIITKVPRLSSWTVIFLVALGSCEGYQFPHRQQTAFLASRQKKSASSCSPLSFSANLDSDFEAALGEAHVSEYERDAEFYRKRNEAYSSSLRKTKDEEVVASFSAPDANALASHENRNNGEQQQHENPQWVTDSINTSVKASQSSFRYVEKTTFSLLKRQPIFALVIFLAAGMTVAYLSGFLFLGGYIDNWNPVDNDMVPYWDDAEIHTIERALPPP